MRKLCIALGLMVTFSGVVQAKVESLDGANLGQWWYGPKYSMEDLKGRVVMVEMWGYN